MPIRAQSTQLPVYGTCQPAALWQQFSRLKGMQPVRLKYHWMFFSTAGRIYGLLRLLLQETHKRNSH